MARAVGTRYAFLDRLSLIDQVPPSGRRRYGWPHSFGGRPTRLCQGAAASPPPSRSASNPWPPSAASAPTSTGASGSVASTTSVSPGRARPARGGLSARGAGQEPAASSSCGIRSLPMMIAAILESGEPERLYTGLSLLVSAAPRAGPRAACLLRRARAAARRRAAGGDDTFSRSLHELRETARELEDCRLWACAAAVERERRERRGDRGAARRRDVDPALPARGRGRAAGGRVRRALAGLAALLAVRRLRRAVGRPVRGRAQRQGPERQRPPARLRRRHRPLQQEAARGDRGGAAADRAPARARPREAGRARARAPGREGRDPPYRVRLEDGTISFSDRSRGVPKSFSRVVAFTSDVAERRLQGHARLALPRDPMPRRGSARARWSARGPAHARRSPAA